MATLLAVVTASCGGSGGGGGSPVPATPPAPVQQVSISGTVSYDFIPVAPFLGLRYSLIEPRPVRLATVQFTDGSRVLATTQTDTNGDYTLQVDSNQMGFIRVQAESRQLGTPGWHFRVIDNTNARALYTLDGAMRSSGTADSQRDLHAPSGWTGMNYGNPRAAAPFAILDTVLEGRELVLSADPLVQFPALDIHWSENNVPARDADGNRNVSSGEIGSTFYRRGAISGSGIYLLGAEDSDTEEYDRHVILHEFGHYLADRLGRSDHVSGSHSISNLLDIRVAFSEGWASAVSALALDDPDYVDSIGPEQQTSFSFSVESGTFGVQGYFSELSVSQLIYDLVDTATDGSDLLSYPFADVWRVMLGHIVDTAAVTSIFPFMNGFRIDHPADAVLLDQLVINQQIEPISDDYGDDETRSVLGSPDVVPLVTPLNVDDPVPVNLCSTDEFGGENKLAARRLLRFTPPAIGNVRITMTATSIPAGEFSDPDFLVHRNGVVLASAVSAPTPACRDISVPGWVAANCSETTIVALTEYEYILEIYEWTNTNASDDTEYPPIGRTCFDVTVTQA